MAQRNAAKTVADSSGLTCDKENYCKLRNLATKLNRCKKKEYFQRKINDSKNDSKQNYGKH